MKRKVSRITVLQILFCLTSGFLLWRLWTLQIVNGENYEENFRLKTTRTIVEKGTRGNIYDCNGELLASNRLIYTVTMTDESVWSSSRERQSGLNGIIFRLRETLKKNGETMCHDLKIRLQADGTYTYTAEGASLLRFLADVFGKGNPDNLTEEQRNMSAEELVRYLSEDAYGLYGTGGKVYTEEERERFGLPKKYTKEELLDILGVRYLLSQNAYQKYEPVTIARDISPETAAEILENREMYTGIEIAQEQERVYEGGEAFAHILGYTGVISPEELEKLEPENPEYSLESVVGKAGVEQYFEYILQGSNGEKTIVVDHVGRVLEETEVVKTPKAGRDIQLSIDGRLQMKVYQILERNLAEILLENLINARTFDKTKIKDTEEIRIPVYEVYTTLVENEILSMEMLVRSDASEAEQRAAAKLSVKKEQVQEAVRRELTEASHPYEELADEMKAYLICLLQNSRLVEEGTDAEWIREETVSLKEFLEAAVREGTVHIQMLELETGYATAEELYEAMVQYLLQEIPESRELEKMMFCALVQSGELTEREFCSLLYEQGILRKDEDYDLLMKGQLAPYEWTRKKIEKLELTPAQLALDPCSASAVIVQKDTGKVLACATYPGYDNNRLANQMDRDYYNRLLRDRSLPMYNRATQQLSAPGSTFKPVTVAAGLQEGVIQTDTEIRCDGVFDRVSPSLRCWKHSGHGPVADAAAALQNSCNDYLCEISYRMGLQADGSYSEEQALHCLQKYAGLFDLDQKSGIELTESSPHVTDQYAIPSAIGQGTHNYATVQLARYMNIFASRGNSYRLSLLKGIGESPGIFFETESELQSEILLPEEVWDMAAQGMLQFAQENSLLKDMKVLVAGKTGTAQESWLRPDHALFVGYAPAEDPEITLAVRIVNGYGSSHAVQVGKEILECYFGEDGDKT